MSARAPLTLVGSLLFAMAAATACASAGDDADSGGGSLRLITTSQDSGRAGELSFSGTIEVNGDGCIGVMNGDDFTVVSWFEGSQLIDGPGVRLPDGREMPLGDNLAGAGTLTDAGEDEEAACPGAEEVLLLGEVSVPR